MSNEPPEPGASEPESPEDPSTRPLPQLPPGYPPRPPQPPYGQPGPPPYAQPGPPPYAQPGPPPYGQPGPPPYAQPGPPPYAQPVWQGHQAPQQQYGWPGQPPYGPPPPKKGRGLLVGLLVVLALALVGAAVVGVLLLTDDSDSGIAVKDISSADCLVGSGLDDAEDKITDLEKVDCGDDHDAEVFATFELGADQDLDAAGSQCVDEAADAGRTLDDLAAADLEIRPLVASDSPDEGDKVVCFIRHPDGSSLSGSEFE